MADYQLNYNRQGVFCSVQDGDRSIPRDNRNSDYQDFLRWNSEQAEPFDLDAVLPASPPSPEEVLAWIERVLPLTDCKVLVSTKYPQDVTTWATFRAACWDYQIAKCGDIPQLPFPLNGIEQV